MVGILISGIVLAAILLNVATTARSSVLQSQQSAMIENGQFALSLLGKNIRNAGYESLTRVESPVIDRKRFGKYILGCESGIISDTASTLPAWGAQCQNSGNNDAIAVRYQGGLLTMLPKDGDSVDSSIYQAVDCAGKAVTDTVKRSDGEDIFIVDNRFYISSDDELVCWGNGDATARPVAQNIEKLQLSYGVSDRVVNNSGFTLLAGQTTRYMTATELVNKYGISGEGEADPWERVTSVRVCVQVKSSEPIFSASSYDYTDCDGNIQTSSDSHIRRALFTTVDVSNIGLGF